MPLYEHVVITRQDISSQQVDSINEKLKGVIEAGDGKITKTEYWGLRTFAYRIKKNRKGHYSFFHIDAPHDAVAEMERQESLDEDVLRVLTLRVDNFDEGDSAMMRRGGRDDRDDRRDRGSFGNRDRNDRGGRRDRPDDRNRRTESVVKTESDVKAGSDAKTESGVKTESDVKAGSDAKAESDKKNVNGKTDSVSPEPETAANEIKE